MSEALTDLAKPVFDASPDEVKEAVSKVLFPETLTDTITLLGKERKVSPLPVKISKKISAALKPFSIQLNKSEGKWDADETLTEALLTVTKDLAEFYDWQDVLEAANTEDLLLDDIQALCVIQRGVCSTSDFLLLPLSGAIGMMQIAEVGMLTARMKSLTTATGQSFLNNTEDAPLTN